MGEAILRTDKEDPGRGVRETNDDLHNVVPEHNNASLRHGSVIDGIPHGNKP